MFRRFIAWLLRKRGPAAPPRGKSPASPPPRQEADRTSAKTERPESNRPDRASSFESEGTAIPELKRQIIFPQSKDREITDRIYAELVSIFGAARIQQTGGQNIPVVFWSVEATEEEVATLREELEADDSVHVYHDSITHDPTDG